MRNPAERTVDALKKLPLELQGHVLSFVPTVFDALRPLIEKLLRRFVPLDRGYVWWMNPPSGKLSRRWILVGLRKEQSLFWYFYVRAVPSTEDPPPLRKRYTYHIYPCGRDSWYGIEWSVVSHTPLQVLSVTL